MIFGKKKVVFLLSFYSCREKSKRTNCFI